MTTYISILRGINVGGHNKIKMEELQQMIAGLGFQRVQTYIQSGNIIFQYKKQKPTLLEKKIAAAIENHFGFNVPVIVMEAISLKEIIDNNPFLKDKTKDASLLHITFLSAEPVKENFDKIKREQFLPDEIQWLGKAVYLYLPNKYSNTKLTNNFLETKLNVTATTRNWKTVNELLNIVLKSAK